MSTSNYQDELKKVKLTHSAQQLDESVETSNNNKSNIEKIEREKAGKNVTGKEFVMGSTSTLTAKEGAEIFNDYTNNKAIGKFSHAEGNLTKALTDYSHAEGCQTSVTGYNGHSEGYQTTALGYGSHAEGNSTNRQSNVINITGSTTDDKILNAYKSRHFSLAKGNYSHVEGENCLALKNDAHAEGYQTTASGSYSHSEGESTNSSGQGAHAEGHLTTASGRYSHAEGSGTVAYSDNQHVQGKYNTEDTASKYAFIIGNGTSDARSNAFAIDWNGLIYVNNASTGVNVATLASTISTMSETIASLEARIAALEGNNAG